MDKFDLDAFILAVRDAAVANASSTAVRTLLATAVENPVAVTAALTPLGDKDECVLFEDETVSIWQCRFHPGVEVPPHEHRIPAFIGVYDGIEENTFYRCRQHGIEAVKTRAVRAGEVLSIGADGIHSVRAGGDGPSDALHVYLGRLTDIERNMFDWDTGQPMPLTMERFAAMTRRSEE